MIILVNMLPCWLLSQCPDTKQQVLIETYRSVADHLYDSYWPSWKEVPGHLLLVDDEREYLFNTSYTDSTFQDSCDGIPSRSATMNKHFLATFPFINYQPTIIIGTPENTNKSPLAWTITLLHEHFHQLQFSHPNYYAAQKSLNLDKGDQTGMWMLNHPFPYEEAGVISKINDMAKNLLSLYENSSIEEVLVRHKKLKEELKTIIGEEHYRYLNLQLWQEGFARFQELSILTYWIESFDQIEQDRFEKSELVSYLEDYQSKILASLEDTPINESKRVYFYALGAAEAMLIKAVNPEWKSAYFDDLFNTDHLLVQH
ncbi:MAG: hypothetical protein R8G66_05135 [Cytophagales bacterium]|nr:hypothetical protein [Cytophagales bacterium]